MQTPDFLVRSVDGTLRAYDGSGRHLWMPRAEAEACAAAPDALLVEMRPEPPQVAENGHGGWVELAAGLDVRAVPA